MCMINYFAQFNIKQSTLFFLSTPFPIAAEEMHPADEPASRGGIPRKSTL